MSLSDDDDTPIIDEGYTARALQIDWSVVEQYPPAVVQCRLGHKEYRSHSKYDMTTSRIIAKLGCPTCGTHELSRTSVVDTSYAVAGEIAAREPVTITRADVGELDHTTLELDTNDDK